MKIEFSGAALGVTGSKHLLHLNEKKILLDCGLFQGRRKQAAIANLNFPFDATEIDACILSHAHIDHSGALPILVKRGFRGKIYCTPATADLCRIMLLDSAYIQEKDAEWLRKKSKNPDAEPLYTISDAEKTLEFLHPVPYHQKFSPAPGMQVEFRDAGHILGSAIETIEIDDESTGQSIQLGFTGDLGRKNLPILRDRESLENLDFLITESTYGNKFHDEIADVEEKLAAEIRVAHERGGKILIPAFAVGRTQEILFVLAELQSSGKIPKIPIFVDSPLATSATEIFSRHPECFDRELNELLASGHDPFCGCDGVKFTRSVEESKKLNEFPGTCIIISASGMCEAGRIRHHLVNQISDPKNTILIVGWMAENTLGRKLVDGEDPVNIFGEPHPSRAKITIFNAFSGHADQRGLLDFAKNAGNLRAIFCVHGEEKQLRPFREKLSQLPNCRNAEIFIPAPGDIFELKSEKKFELSAGTSEKRIKSKKFTKSFIF